MIAFMWDQACIKLGFWVFGPDIHIYLECASSVVDAERVKRLAQAGELMGYPRTDLWGCFDTLEGPQLANGGAAMPTFSL